MAVVKISQLPDASLPLSGSELVPMVQNGVTVKAPSAQTDSGVNVLSYFTAAQITKIKNGTTDFDCSAGIEAAIATSRRVYMPKGLYKCNINITSRTIIYGDGSTSTLVKPWSDSVAIMTYKYAAMSNPAPLVFWTYHSQIRDIGFHHNIGGVGVGFTFSQTTLASPPIQNAAGVVTAAGPADQYSNNVSFYNCRFWGLEKGVLFPDGNIGSQFYSCAFAANKYGVYTINNKFGGDPMHAGNKYFYDGEFSLNEVGVYINNSSPVVYGAINFSNTIIENNKIGVYAYNSGHQNTPLSFHGCWFESNGLTLNGIPENVNIDSWAGSVRTVVAVPKRSWIFEGDRANVKFDACGVVSDINCASVNAQISLRDCQTERTVGVYGGGSCTVDSTSLIINDSPRSEAGLLVDDNVITTGYARLGQSTINVAGPFDPIAAKSRYFYVDERSGIVPNMQSLVASETFTAPYTLKDGTGGAPLTGTVVQDGRLFKTCNEFTDASFTSAEFHGMYDTAVGATTGWYVFTIDVKVTTCADLNSLTFYFWNQNQGGELGSLVYDARVPALNKWYTMTAYAYLNAPLTYKMYFDVQGPTVAGTNTVWRLSAFQAHRFDTVDECISFIKGGALSYSGLTLDSTANRIRADFTNATISDRTLFQTLTSNSATRLGAIPNGSSTSSTFNFLNSSSATNCGIAQVSIDNTVARFSATRTGSGSFLPIELRTSDLGRFRIDVNGEVGIGTETTGGTTTQANTQLYNGGVYKANAGVARVYGTGGTFPSTTTSAAQVFRSDVATEAAAFTLPTLDHYFAGGTGLGAGSALTNEYAFHGNLAAGTGKWNFYGGGTARNYFAGGVEVVSGATNMTSGFTHIPSAAGAPTGAPTNPSGNVPMYYDSTNNKIYVYSGGTWRSTAALT